LWEGALGLRSGLKLILKQNVLIIELQVQDQAAWCSSFRPAIKAVKKPLNHCMFTGFAMKMVPSGKPPRAAISSCDKAEITKQVMR
jgi:hypothetical protein